MEDPYIEFITRVGNMGFTGQLAPSLQKMNDQNLLEVLNFLFETYDTDLYRGKDKSTSHMVKVFNRMSLGHLVKDSKMVTVQNKKILLALNGVVDKLVDKFGEDIFKPHKGPKKLAKSHANKENTLPPSPAHNLQIADEERGQKRHYNVDIDAGANAEDVFAKKAKVVRTPQSRPAEDPFARKSNLARTPLQPAEPNSEETREDVFAKKANVMRTPVQFVEPALGNREDVFGKKAKLARTPIQTADPNSDEAREDVFSKKANVMRTPVQFAKPAPGENLEDVFGKKAKLARTPVQPAGPHTEGAREDAFGKQSKLMRTPIQPADPITEENREDVFPGKTKLARAPLQPTDTNEEDNREEVFAKKSKVLRTPAHSEPEQRDDGGAFAQNSKMARTPLAPVDTDPAGDAFSKKSKLTRAPDEQVLHPDPSHAAESDLQTPAHGNAEERDQIFAKKAKLQRTPAQPAAQPTSEREDAFGKKSKLQRTPAAQAAPTENREEVFMKKSKLARTPVQDSHPVSDPPPNAHDAATAFISKSRIQRSPLPELNARPNSDPVPDSEPNPNLHPDSHPSEPNPKTTANSSYGDVFATKTKLARTPHLPAVPAPPTQPESAQEEEDDTIMKFPTQKSTPKKRSVITPQPILTTTQPPKPTTPSQKPKPLQHPTPSAPAHAESHPSQTQDRPAPRTPTRPTQPRTPSRSTQPRTPTRSMQPRTPTRPTQLTPSRELRGAQPRTPTRPTQLTPSRELRSTQPRTPTRPTQLSPVRQTPSSRASAPFNDVTGPYTNSAKKPVPALRTPLSEKTASLLTPMKNGQLLEKRTPLASATKRVTRSPSSATKTKPKTPSKVIDPTLINPTLLRPDPFDYSEEAEENLDTEIVNPIRFDLEPKARLSLGQIGTHERLTDDFDRPISAQEKQKNIEKPADLTENLADKILENAKPPIDHLEVPMELPIDFGADTVLADTFEAPIYVEKHPVVPDVRLGENEMAYLKEREEAQITNALQAELEQVTQEITQVTKKRETMVARIEKMNVDIDFANKLKQAALATLQKTGQPTRAHDLPQASALVAEIGLIKAQEQQQEAKLREARAVVRNLTGNLQIVDQQLRDVTSNIAASEMELASLSRNKNDSATETIRTLDAQIREQAREFEADRNEIERARREIESLRSFAPRPAALPVMGDKEREKEAEKAKRRMENMVLRGKLLSVISNSMRNIDKMTRKR